MYRNLLLLMATALLVTGCEPSDPEIRSGRGRSANVNKLEDPQTSALDHIEHVVYRLAEMKTFVEVALGPEQRPAESNSPCGLVEVDRKIENHRTLRLITDNCIVDRNEDRRALLRASGSEALEASFDAAGLVQLNLRSLDPLRIAGQISQGEERDSQLMAFEKKSLAIEKARGDYKFTYAIELNWQQRLQNKTSRAFDDGKLYVTINGSFALQENRVADLKVGLVRVEGRIPREVQSRKKGGGTFRTFYDLDLLMESSQEKDSIGTLNFDQAECTLPEGDLVVLRLKSTNRNDKLTTRDERMVKLSPVGARVTATDENRLWHDCNPALKIPVPGVVGKVIDIPARKPKKIAGQLASRIPYLNLFFK